MENLYRGKCKANNIWYYGCLYKDRFIISDGEEEYAYGGYSESAIGTWIDTDMYCVDPETVGQYIGREDKNGKKIFKGDIIKCTPAKDIQCGKDSNIIGEVCGDVLDGIKVRQIAIGFMNGIMWHLSCFYEVEVIGNIHDNPELLNPKSEVSHE